MNNRLSQIDTEIQREMSSLLRQIKDPRVHGLVSVVRVETARDLSQCKVYISALEDHAQVMKGLASATGFLRRGLSSALNLRHTPQLIFVQDESIKEGVHLLSLLNQTVKSAPADAPAEDADLEE